MTGLPPEVAAAVDDLVARVDAGAPGWLVGLHLVGSVALEDFHAHTSDVDFVGLFDRDLTDREVAALELVHLDLHAEHSVSVDGVYLPSVRLLGHLDPHEQVPFARNGKFAVGTCFELNPVTLLSLATASIAIRGEAPTPFLDDRGTAAWCRENLATYWRDLAAYTRDGLIALPHDSLLPGAALAWLVLGPPRLHCTLTTGSIISKTAAAGYASQMFDLDWIDILAAARAARLGEIDSVTVAQMRTACDFVDMVIDSP